MEWDGQSFASGTLWYDHNLSHGAVGWDEQGVANGTDTLVCIPVCPFSLMAQWDGMDSEDKV